MKTGSDDKPGRLAGAAVAAILLATALPHSLRAADFPHFQPGLWEFKRSVEGVGPKPQSMSMKQCTDPSADMAKQNASVGNLGCKASPVSQSDNTYTFTLDCMIEGSKLQSRSVITAESETSYRVDVESNGANIHSKEVMVAKRVGDCPKQ